MFCSLEMGKNIIMMLPKCLCVCVYQCVYNGLVIITLLIILETLNMRPKSNGKATLNDLGKNHNHSNMQQQQQQHITVFLI